jgi:maltose O-acetyltransferase
MTLGKLVLGAGHARSWRWNLWVNGLAASPLVSVRVRRWMYRRAGMNVDTDGVEPRCYFHTAQVDLAEGAYLNYGAHIHNVERVSIGRRAGLGIHAVVLTSAHAIGPETARMGEWQRMPVVIEDGCWLGARVTVLGGVRIGRGCIVAAGAVVTGDCEPNGVYGGVPAKRLRDLAPGEGG